MELGNKFPLPVFRVSCLAPSVLRPAHARSPPYPLFGKANCQARTVKGEVMTQSFSVHQFHYHAAYGDAVTSHLFFLQTALRKVGVGGEVFAKEIKHFKKGEVKHFHSDQVWNCDLLLIHHSLGNPLLPELLELEIPKAVVYHNITPHVFFKHDIQTRDLCLKGREQLYDLKKHCITSFAVSLYNASELKSFGFQTPKILPLLNLQEDIALPSRPKALSAQAPRRLLFVGRLAPHKNQKLLIETFFYLKNLLPRGSQLNIVGSGDVVYKRYLEDLIRQLGLSENIHLRGKLTDQELASFYESSDAFVCTSLHEGFCIPLADAMQAGLPIFYLPQAAIPETMGRSGVRLETEDPYLIAQAITEVLKDSNVVEKVVASQNARIKELADTQNEKQAQMLLLNLLQTLRPAPKTLSRDMSP